MVKTQVLRAYMTLKGVTTKDLADAQGWGMSTAYRKLTGKSAFTVPEMQLCQKFLDLDASTMSAIFFAPDLS